MTIEEFRSFGDPVGHVTQMPDEMFRVQMTAKTYPLPSTSQQPPSMSASSSDRKMSDIHNTVGGGNETLKLKRPKPLKRDENNLEKSLGIIRNKKSA